MLPPELIDRLNREKEERDYSSSQIPLYLPIDVLYPEKKPENEEKTQKTSVIVIQM